MKKINREKVNEIISRLHETFKENKDYLIELDAEMGDGDLGLTMVKAFSRADNEKNLLEEKDLGKVFLKLGMAMAKAAPSTMGTLIATGFMKGGKALFGKEEIDTADFALFFNHFVDGIMERGKSKPGEKTIIDSLKPSAETLSNASSKELKEAFKDALESAEGGLQATRNMEAKHGRIAYYQDKSKGKQDPGATVGVLLIKGIYDVL